MFDFTLLPPPLLLSVGASTTKYLSYLFVLSLPPLSLYSSPFDLLNILFVTGNLLEALSASALFLPSSFFLASLFWAQQNPENKAGLRPNVGFSDPGINKFLSVMVSMQNVITGSCVSTFGPMLMPLF